MNLDVKKLEKNYLEIVLKGEDISLADSLREVLIADKDVEFASAMLSHPQIGNPTIIVRTKTKDVLELLIKAVEKVKGNADDFKTALKASKKSK